MGVHRLQRPVCPKNLRSLQYLYNSNYFAMFAGIVNDLFKPQLPSSQIVKMGIDANDIGEVPILAQTKRQSSQGNGQVPTDAQSNTDNKQSNTNKKEGEHLHLRRSITKPTK